ncbi:MULTISPECIES: hypothetical protein [unclassified Nitratiruptor]|uniref:plasmid mobilization protein n=1 Tax=unclassified Nitratiruptor TaxID=2624044 RepID=UPI0018ED6BA7|nr:MULTISPECIES: hypothetical protein [unclassified Nitratiruptor]BCD61145.1 hypothetical protein NitYY0810_P07 [Nitratiruptor sp. YY08-10]BCD65078.1 hypothetical protein NitYY0814_P07 [Nitratiruptor sp. YY08-14]
MSGKFGNVKLNREISTHKDMQKYRGGRPKMDEYQKKKEKVFVSFTVEEKEKLKEHADKSGMPVATFIRKVLKDNGYI